MKNAHVFVAVKAKTSAIAKQLAKLAVCGLAEPLFSAGGLLLGARSGLAN